VHDVTKLQEVLDEQEPSFVFEYLVHRRVKISEPFERELLQYLERVELTRQHSQLVVVKQQTFQFPKSSNERTQPFNFVVVNL
jgi:hypothetical protein